MASVDDVFNKLGEVSDRLQNLHNDMSVQTDVIKGFRDANHNDLVAQTTILSQIGSGISDLFAVLKHISLQQETAICLLGNIAKHTCAIWNEEHWQTEVLQQIKQFTNESLLIAQTTSPAATLEVRRLQELKAEVERCCPPPTPETICKRSECSDPGPFKEGSDNPR